VQNRFAARKHEEEEERSKQQERPRSVKKITHLAGAKTGTQRETGSLKE
jgi:hypothetical protein